MSHLKLADQGSVVFRVLCSGIAVFAVLCSSFGSAPVRAEVLRAATDEWQPFRIETEKGFIGLDLDILSEVSKRIGAPVEVIQMPWGRGLASMESGAVDIMTGLAYRAERAEYIAYTQTPYYSCETAFYTSAANPVPVASYEDLAGHTIGFVLHSAYFERFDKDETLDKLGVAQEQILIDMLLRGRLDLMIGTDCQVDYSIQVNDLADKIAKTSFRPGNSVDLYLGVSKKSPWAKRLRELEAVIKTLVEEGFVLEQARRYYDSPS